MKVILLAPLPSPPYGGIQAWTARMIAAKLKDGWTVDVVDERLICREIFGQKSKKNYLVEAKRCYNIWKNLKNECKNPDVKIVHSNIPSFMTSMMREYVCAKIAKRKGKKFVVEFHCTVPNTTKGKLGWFLLKKICGISDMIFVLNKQSYDSLEKITNTPMKIIPNFVEESELVRTREINGEMKTVLFVGGLIESKGVGDLLKVAGKMPELQFRFVGSGDDCFERYAKEKGLTNVTFTGVKDKSGVREELMHADVFAFLSFFRGEGFSVALTEAMAAGLPCLVTDWAANANMVGKDGGEIIALRDVDAAVDALNRMKPYEVRKKQSNANIKKVEAFYTDKTVLNMFVDSYNEMLGGKA